MIQLPVADRLVLMQTTLERAAEELGDLTEPVTKRFYRRCPAAAASFRELGLGEPRPLEARMIESVLFCLMTWLEERPIVEMLIQVYLPHHYLTLGVEVDWFRAMVEETADIIAETIPPGNAAERAAWSEISSGVLAVIADALATPDMVRWRASREPVVDKA